MEETSLLSNPNLSRFLENQMEQTGEALEDVSKRVAEQMQAAAIAQFGAEFDIRAHIDETGTLRLVHVLSVVETVENECREVSLKNARRHFSNSEIAQKIANPLEFTDLKTPAGLLSTVRANIKNAKLTQANA